MKAKDYALAEAAKPALGHTGFIIVASAALLSTFSAINASIYGNARLGYTIAKDGKLPHALMDLKREIPSNGVIYTTLFSLILANSIDLTQIAIIGSASFLLIFSIVNLSAYKLKKEIKASASITIFSTLLAYSALVTLLFHTYHSDPKALLIFGAFILISLLFELSYGRYVRGHIFNRSY